jgi:hypothetical protein
MLCIVLHASMGFMVHVYNSSKRFMGYLVVASSSSLESQDSSHSRYPRYYFNDITKSSIPNTNRLILRAIISLGIATLDNRQDPEDGV